MPTVLSANEETGELEMQFTKEEQQLIMNKVMNEMFTDYVKATDLETSIKASRILVFEDSFSREYRVVNVTSDEQYQTIIKILFKYMENGGWMDEDELEGEELELAQKGLDGDYDAMHQFVLRYQGEEACKWHIQQFTTPEEFEEFLNEEFE
jgi:hypothetical protein